jgi:hypothetical protein
MCACGVEMRSRVDDGARRTQGCEGTREGREHALENEVALLQLLLLGRRVDDISLGIGRNWSDVEGATGLLFGVQRQSLARSEIKDVLLDSFC